MEYIHGGKKYIRVQANMFDKCQLSNGKRYKDGDFVWVEVSPIVWLIDDDAKKLVSKKGLLAGIRYLANDVRYDGDFSMTEMKVYLDNYMSNDMFQSIKNKK